MLQSIVPQDELVAAMTNEIETLAAEIFATTYNCSWARALDEAFISVIEMLDYADDWDHTALIEQRTQREIDLMVQTKCSPELAIDAVRVSDGRPVWAEVEAEFDPDAGDDGDPSRDYLAERYSSGFSATRRRMYEEV